MGKAKSNFDIALAFSQEHQLRELEGCTLLRLAKYHEKTGDIDMAKQQADYALELFLDIQISQKMDEARRLQERIALAKRAR